MQIQHSSCAVSPIKLDFFLLGDEQSTACRQSKLSDKNYFITARHNRDTKLLIQEWYTEKERNMNLRS
jgi:hypothetical protein